MSKQLKVGFIICISVIALILALFFLYTGQTTGDKNSSTPKALVTIEDNQSTYDDNYQEPDFEKYEPEPDAEDSLFETTLADENFDSFQFDKINEENGQLVYDLNSRWIVEQLSNRFGDELIDADLAHMKEKLEENISPQAAEEFVKLARDFQQLTQSLLKQIIENNQTIENNLINEPSTEKLSDKEMYLYVAEQLALQKKLQQTIFEPNVEEQLFQHERIEYDLMKGLANYSDKPEEQERLKKEYDQKMEKLMKTRDIEIEESQ